MSAASVTKDVKQESLSLPELLKVLNPSGMEYLRKYIPEDEASVISYYELVGVAPLLGSTQVPLSEIHKDKVGKLPFIGLEPPVFTVTCENLPHSDDKMKILVSLLGLPTDVKEYPDSPANDLRHKIIETLSYLRKGKFLTPINEGLLEAFKKTAQSLESFAIYPNDSIGLLFVDGKLTKRQITGRESKSEELFDSQGRIVYGISEIDSSITREAELIDLPNPFYLVKIYFIKEDAIDLYYSAIDYENGDNFAISPSMYRRILRYIEGEKKLMAQQFQEAVLVNVPEMVSIIGSYL
jgi:hypothetical protein